jgi:hypothetical protein
VAYIVVVQLRDGGQEIISPEMDEQEADRQIELIREALVTGRAVDVPWLAVSGTDVMSAHKRETIA